MIQSTLLLEPASIYNYFCTTPGPQASPICFLIALWQLLTSRLQGLTGAYIHPSWCHVSGVDSCGLVRVTPRHSSIIILARRFVGSHKLHLPEAILLVIN
ncbi:hypothetical protein OIU74_002223 [Salix koriyanagi]|uniref:Uncharacterized protein n=1 Tax=Salix koriyanagi TaxID=2511006 RepID=A0A9Q0X5D4_9ROSI|nr:hypothetical protein OIU74_002223 [Salix koriyanagi]